MVEQSGMSKKPVVSTFIPGVEVEGVATLRMVEFVIAGRPAVFV